MDEMKPLTAISTAESFVKGVDMSSREEEILSDVENKTGFKRKKNIWRSSYYGSSQIGAVHWLGKFDGEETILKIQGVKPEISEIEMLSRFEEQNQSSLVRSPILYKTLPWDDKAGYEALIMEFVAGKKILESGKVLVTEDVAEFFRIYREYKTKCINKPWLPKPESVGYTEKDFQKAKVMIAKLKPGSPFREDGDFELCAEAIAQANKVWSRTKPEFMHGHFSAEDLIWQGDQVILFSNLFWRWTWPFYDAVFAYHWSMYGLAKIPEISPEVIEQQRGLWLSQMEKLSIVKNDDDLLLLKTALLERSVAGLLMDGIMFVDEENPIKGHIVEATRNQVRSLTKEITGR